MKNETNNVINELNKKWTIALVNNDQGVLDEILTNDFVIQGVSEVHNGKASYLNFVKSGKSNFLEGDIIKTLVKENLAIVVGKSYVKGDEKYSGNYIYTNVFEKRNNKWYGVASQSVKL